MSKILPFVNPKEFSEGIKIYETNIEDMFLVDVGKRIFTPKYVGIKKEKKTKGFRFVNPKEMILRRELSRLEIYMNGLIDVMKIPNINENILYVGNKGIMRNFCSFIYNVGFNEDRLIGKYIYAEKTNKYGMDFVDEYKDEMEIGLIIERMSFGRLNFSCYRGKEVYHYLYENEFYFLLSIIKNKQFDLI